ncbi:Oligopeptide transporter 5 [Ceratobasidium theobromae]|uniref:Oligopeptide transporter 5 n=1 Tax=Ceratobasidium theobromae TaxID=1582974 RepID=A0A5N5QBE7_9AGAM|nr:Oligopeptide transporter 5 [Ceratobasidium theobromae]
MHPVFMGSPQASVDEVATAPGLNVRPGTIPPATDYQFPRSEGLGSPSENYTPLDHVGRGTNFSLGEKEVGLDSDSHLDEVKLVNGQPVIETVGGFP